MIESYPKDVQTLPVYPHLDEICQTLKGSESKSLVLTAQTAAGKSTAVPLALLKHFSGKIYMLEPRRLAVLNVANRVSSLLGEKPGATCGYSVHLESRVSPKTRFMVMTEAVLIRKIQSDPMLDGVSVVVIDEFHERTVHGDLLLAFLKETLSLRDDLYVLVMSATIDTSPVSSFLGTVDSNGKSVPCPVLSVPGRQFPVTVEYAEKKSLAQAVLAEIKNPGTVLVFLPGIKEIRSAQRDLEALFEQNMVTDCELMLLHSSVPFDEQKKIFDNTEGSGKKRVILSSAIAETSVTVPDVKVVIDTGWCRVNEFNQSLGTDELVTVRESMFSAEQRKGRAGRLSEGKCIRLWPQFESLSKTMLPEIMRSDLVPLVLECYEWGIRSPESLSWLDKPSDGAWAVAESLLELLGCARDGSITDAGKACLALGVHPRVACVALSGLVYGDLDLSTRVAANIGCEKTNTGLYAELLGKDLKKRIQMHCDKSALSPFFPQISTEFSTSCALLYGYPDRLALKLADEKNVFQLASGHKASVMGTDFCQHKYIIALSMDAGGQTGKIYSYEPVNAELAEAFISKRCKTVVKSYFSGKQKELKKSEYKCYGKIVLGEKRLVPSKEDFSEAVCNSVEDSGLEWLGLGDSSKRFLLRVQFYIQQGGKKAEELKSKYESLEKSSREWLLPFLSGNNSLNEQTVFDALYYWLEGEEIKKMVPEILVLTNGKKAKVKYEVQGEKIQPCMEIIIQQIFGCLSTPAIMGCNILIKMLSPARRPLQITSDLENFWQNTWPEICKEMKGRYPKHNWDYRLVSAED